jgi:ankyrin repeat protein
MPGSCPCILQALSKDGSQKSDDSTTNIDYYHDHLRRDFVFPKHKDLAIFLAEFGIEAILALVIGQRTIDVNGQDDKGRTPLMRATERGHTDIAKLLLGTDRVEIDAKSKDGSTALILTAKFRRKDIFELLFNTGKCEVDAKDRYAFSALLYAAREGQTDICRLLLSTVKVDVNTKTRREIRRYILPYLMDETGT